MEVYPKIASIESININRRLRRTRATHVHDRFRFQSTQLRTYRTCTLVRLEHTNCQIIRNQIERVLMAIAADYTRTGVWYSVIMCSGTALARQTRTFHIYILKYTHTV